jgi:predicted Zn-dependent peptidase
LAYLKKQYGGRSIYVVLAGGIKETDKKAAAKMFRVFPANPWRDKLPVREKQSAPQLKISHKKIDQVNLSLGVRAYPVGHPEEFRVKLLSIILGGSMSSRLFISLRERHGLAYSVRTSSEFYSDSGYLTTQAGVPIGKAAAAVKIILAEYRRIAREPVGAKELQRAKDLMAGRALLQLEATDDLANWYARQAVLRKKILTPREFLAAIKKIKPAALVATAKKIFVNRGLNLAVIGRVKAADFKPILKL